MIIGIRHLFLRRLAPVYAIILVTLISAAVNQTWIGALNATLKWLYLIVFAVAGYLAMRRVGSERVLRALAVIFLGPIILLWLSVPWGLEFTNEDGTTSFIGGYQHQQSISIIFMTFLYLTCFSRDLNLITTYGRLAISVAGIILANYRTALLATALPAASLVISKLTGKFVPKHRSVVYVFLAVATIFVFVGIMNLSQRRFVDIGTTLDKGASLIQPPEHFTAQEMRLFSGRLYLWTQYVDAYRSGNIINILLGFGPEAWVGEFRTYAHNTFVSYLYELGIFGLAAFIWILLANSLTAFRTRTGGKLVLISCHVGFVVLNLATMPIWTLEGAMLYALLLSQTWYSQA
jgi:hypothetical protein